MHPLQTDRVSRPLADLGEPIWELEREIELGPRGTETGHGPCGDGFDRSIEVQMQGVPSMSGLPPIEQRTLPCAFARALEAVPEKVAYVDAAGNRWSYRQTYDRSMVLAGGLLRLGVRRQQAVAVLLDNSLDFLQVVFGLGLSGRVQVPINTAYKGDFLAHILNDSGAELLVVEDRYVDRVTQVADRLRTLRHVVVRGGEGAALRSTRLTVSAFDALLAADPAVPESLSAADLMAYMYTSGTTGVSKGVEVRHAHAYTYASREDAALPRSDDCVLVTLPMFHLAGQWYGAYQSLIAQASCVIQPAFSVSKFWNWVREFGVTETVMLGGMAELLQQAGPRPDDADNTLRFAVMAPLASDFDAFRKRFGVEIGAVYGMTEIGAVMGSEPPDVVAGEAGKARQGYQLRLVDLAGNDAPDGTAGELWVRPESPLLRMRGYHGLPQKTAETIVDGWVHTGDIFRRDAQGHYFFMDRSKDALRRRGENVSSFEVERALNAYPDVLESAVVAVASELSEDEIKAVVVAREGHTLDFVKLTQFMVERVPYFMVPRYFERIDELPKTPTMKIQKHLLRAAGVNERVWDRQAAGITVSRYS